MPISVSTGLRTLGLAVAVAIAGCSGGSDNDDLPLLKATIKVKNVSQGGVCDVLPVRITPKELRGEANKYANAKQTVTEVTTKGPTDENGVPTCNGEAESLPLAPGDWEFKVALASDTYSCVHEIKGGGDLVVEFADGVAGCGDAPAAEAAAPAGSAPVGSAAAGSAPAAAPAG
ncbi:MAG: hypothetical protein U1F14_00075 [Steroidobacteraceae bacterium]